MHQYEMAILYHSDLEIDLDKASNKVEKIIKDNNGKIVSVDNWGKRKLAYPINKQEHAIYVFYQVELSPSEVSKIEATLNITDEVIRFLITRPDLKALAKAEAAKAAKLKKANERSKNDDSSKDESDNTAEKQEE